MSNEYCVMCGGYHPLVTNGCDRPKPTLTVNFAPAESVSPAPQHEDHIIELPPMHEYNGEKIHHSPSPVAAPQEVKRFACGYDLSNPIIEEADGPYVLHSDYVSKFRGLEANIRSLAKLAEDTREELGEALRRAEKAESQVADMRKALEEARDILEHIRDSVEMNEFALRATAREFLSEVKP